MDITKIILTPAQIFGNNEGIAILLESTPGYLYENGKRTETQTHIKYMVVFPDNNFEKLPIKVAGTKEIVNNEFISQQREAIKVKFKNLRGKFYRTKNGEYALSCTADSIELLK